MTPTMTVEVLDVLGRVDHLMDSELFQIRQRLIADLELNERDLVARVKTFQVMRLAFDGRRFDIEMPGIECEPAGLIGALDEDERLLDLVAWPLAAPRQLATLLGRVSMLGEHQLGCFEPLGHRVVVHRSALSWLRAGCAGVAPIDPLRAARRFLDLDGRLVAEDRAHARELAEARAALVDRSPPTFIAQPTRRAA